MEKYQDLTREIKRIWNMRTVIVAPVAVRALGIITKKLGETLEKLDTTLNKTLFHKTSLETARILRY